MQTRAAARRSATAAPAWADLPPPLWEAVAELLPIPDLLSLRQAWRGASRLASKRVRNAAFSGVSAELYECVLGTNAAATFAATNGAEGSVEEVGYVEPGFVIGFMEGATAQALGDRWTGAEAPQLNDDHSCRCTWKLRPRNTGILMQAVVAFKTAMFALDDEPAVDIEELRFLTPEGALIAKYCLQDSLDEDYQCTCHYELGAGTAMAGLRGRELSHALQASAEQQPLRTAAGGWSDGVLLTAIHAAVTCFYPEL